MNMGVKSAALFTALIAVLAAGLLCGPARAEDKAEIDRLFNQAKDLWEQGNNAQAAEMLKQVVAQNPSHETAYGLLRKAEVKMFLDLLTEGGDSRTVVEGLMKLAHLGEFERQKDEDAIRALVKDVIGGADYGVREKAIRTLVARHGEYSVPYLFEYLGSNDTDERVYAVLALSELGSDAVLPLVEALHSDNFMIQQNAALVLQKIGDIRAVGGLLALADRAENPAVKEAAAGAAAGMGAHNIKTVNAYLTLAQKYYEREASVIKNYLGNYAVWKWMDGAIVDRDVPKFLYHLELAEESLYDALDADPENAKARAMLTAIHCAEWGAIDALPADLKTDPSVEELAGNLRNVLALSASQGPDALLDALGTAIEWRDANISRGAMAVLPEVWDGRAIDPRSPLIEALGVSDKTVRFAAAVCLLKINPDRPFPGSDQVVPIAAQAVDTIGVRQVLLIEPDAALRAKSLRALDKAGFYAAAEASGVTGFRRAKDVGTFDVVAVRANLEDELALTLVRQLKEDFRTAATVVLVTATEEEMEAAKNLFGTNVDGYVSADPLDVEQIKIEADKSLNDEQQRAREISKIACDALAGISRVHTAFGNYAEAVPALVKAVGSDKPDENRLAALAALANIGNPDAGEALAETFGDTANDVQVRIGAARALGGCYSGVAAPDKIFEALLAGLGDEDMGVRQAVGNAFGEMRLTPAQMNEVLQKYRVL
jgi:HEAT repeat protein